MDNYLRICGHIRGSMFLNILMSAPERRPGISVPGVFGWGSGVRPLATCAGMMVCAVIAFIPFSAKGAAPVLPAALFRTDDPADCRLRKPELLNNIAGRVTSIIMNAILVRLGGETAVSVYGVLMFAEGFIQPLLLRYVRFAPARRGI